MGHTITVVGQPVQVKDLHLGEVEHVLLQIAAVRHAPYLAPERINLVHKLRLGWPSHGRVARLHISETRSL